ncbi:MAG TPA: hypothetical protein VFE60_10105 [Roseiarcus sp.]|nr:hypothetical protein [Roseiarcus sp.]
MAELSAQMHSRWHRVLYGEVAREIDASFVEAQMRLGLRQSAYAKDTKTAAGALRRASASVRDLARRDDERWPDALAAPSRSSWARTTGKRVGLDISPRMPAVADLSPDQESGEPRAHGPSFDA